MPESVRLHRVLRAPAERVHRAFLDPAAICKWSPPHGFTGYVSHSDPRIGGFYRMCFTNFATGSNHSFGGEYLELVEHQRIHYTDRFDAQSLPGTMLTSIDLKEVPDMGAELTIEQTGIPDATPVAACHFGWQESMLQLAQLVEPEIPDHVSS
jgi:uncharacterized protein YndB with AHSA1/START domain